MSAPGHGWIGSSIGVPLVKLTDMRLTGLFEIALRGNLRDHAGPSRVRAAKYSSYDVLHPPMDRPVDMLACVYNMKLMIII